MRTMNEAHDNGGVVVPRFEEQIVCSACGYDLDEAELTADNCSDCGASLNLAQHVRIYATSLPAAQGTTLG